MSGYKRNENSANDTVPVMREKRYNELWLTEESSEGLRLSLKVTDILHREKTKYQDILVVDTPEYGRTLMLDGAFQLTERDEFCYSEMMAHVPLCSHPAPKRVLIIGGGDGAILREVLRHDCVECCTLIDIDERVIAVSKEYLPTVGCALDDPRADVRCMDALEYIKAEAADPKGARFDVAIVDSTDPVEFAAGLFQALFYEDLKRVMNPGGMVTELTESPFTDTALMKQAISELRRVFDARQSKNCVRMYWGAVPTYPSGMWTYAIAVMPSGDGNIADTSVPVREVRGTRYYTREIHKAAFVLPPFLREIIK